MFFGKHLPPTFVPAAAAAGGALLVFNLFKRKRPSGRLEPRSG
jgi:Ni/Fe-hydrogenase subunit HybB-like protein